MAKMKTYYLDHYGDPEEVLQLQTVEIPKPSPKEVLLKVQTSAINDYDWALTSGTPFAYRLFFGLIKPRKKMRYPGMEVAGIVEKAGANVKNLNAGDRVYGDTSDHGFGSLAEYMVLNEKALRKMPNDLSFEEGVALPHASALAMQGLKDVGQIKKGEKVLINGGGGGVGMLGIQIAKTYGAEITGVDSRQKLDRMLQMGCESVIDYREEDFTRSGGNYDLILDCRTSRWPLAHLRALKSGGRYVSIGGQSGKLIAMMLLSRLIKLITKKKLLMVAVKANKDLPEIERLRAEGKLKCEIDGPYPFEKTPWAIKRFGKAEHTGKVVIKIGGSQ
ncbi:MAG: NADPH:quinone reductase-like Zn-dependent oxidoreductase [Cryomorphaceae bacterium]|jgi:NADPH:quinone reductase-like Zn-dependent oxidoreductase